MTSIYALLIAIDDYPIEQHRLAGCINDLKAFEAYLTNTSSTDSFQHINIKTLINQEATRENTINAFDFFLEAEDQDQCLLYFCGHGSRSPAPADFWHLNPDQMNESILCWDSRLDGGRDLIDKELSYLIWKVTNNRSINLVVIMDCCHSGSNTRTPGQKARMATPSTTTIQATDYLGYSTYKTIHTAQGTEATPPVGNYIHLAAAKNNETAKELQIDSIPRGVFTYSMLEVLKQTDHILSYGELVNRIAVKIRGKVNNQSPQVSTVTPGHLKLPFLGGMQPQLYSWLISHHPVHGWVVGAGAIHGLIASSSNKATLLQLENHREKAIRVTQVFPAQSKISGMDGFAKDQSFRARLISKRVSQLKIALEENHLLETIHQLLDEQKNEYIQIVDSTDSPRFSVGATTDGYQLSASVPDSTAFSVLSTNGHSRDATLHFISKIELIAKWHQLLELTNPTSRIGSKELKIELFKIIDPGNHEDNAAVQSLNWLLPDPFEYIELNGWQNPAFQLKITNTGTRTLWVSALYLSTDYSITNQLLAKQELSAGTSVWLTDIYEGYPYRTIPLQVDDLFFDAGLNTITDYIKIIASTVEIDTEGYNQEQLFDQSEALSINRGMGRRKPSQQADWATREIELRIIRNEPPKKIIKPPTPVERTVTSSRPKHKKPPTTRPPVSVKSDFNPSSEKQYEGLPEELLTSNRQGSPKSVDCSIYATPSAAVGDEVLIQVWLHLPDQHDAVESKATSFDEEATQRAFQSLSLALEENDALTLVLTSRGIQLDEASQQIRWNGGIQSAQFFAFIPENFAKNKAIFTLRVFKDDLPIGHLKFIIKISKAAIVVPPKQVLGTEAKLYKKAFISYASKDRNEVLKRVQMLDKLGISFFQDLINLNAGERWEQKLYENIADADLFLLFWSTAAKESTWVLKELQYAISLKQNQDDHPPVIQPVPIEGPPIVYPPKELGHMHFNDRILYFIVKE